MGGKGSGRKIQFDDEYHKIHRQKIAQSRAQSTSLKQRNHAILEELQYRDYAEMNFEWCVEARMSGGESREEAEEYCRGSSVDNVSVDVKDVFPSFATDKEKPIHPKILKRLQKTDKTVMQNPDEPCNTCHTVGSVNLWIDSDGSRRTVCSVCGVTKDATPATLDGLGIVDRETTEYERCVSLRMDVHGENEVDARASCDQIMSDPMFRHLWKEQLDAEKTRKNTIVNYMDMYSESREEATDRFEHSDQAPRRDVFRELGERVYIKKRLHGFSEDAARRQVESEMAREGKLADLNVPKAPGETVGDLFEKTKEQIIKEDSQPARKARLTVGNLYMKKKKKGGDK